MLTHQAKIYEKTTEEKVRQTLSVFPETKDTNLKTIWSAYEKAKDVYLHEKRTPYAKSQLGGRFGFFSGLRHGQCPLEFEKQLAECQDYKTAENLCIHYLKDRGSLWDYKGHVHSFSNYFLTKLREENLNCYKIIVSCVYSIRFISDEPITLLRNDNRPSQTIFSSGFNLRSWSNSYGSRKSSCGATYTYSHGISTAKADYDLSRFGYYQYQIKLPKGHSLLAIDINESPRNAYYRRDDLNEVNFIDPIPAHYVYSCKDRKGTIYNSNFSENPDMSKQGLKPRGCY